MTVEQSVDTLALSVRGHVLRAGDDAFDAARHVWNGMIDRRPKLIVRCAGAADVIAAVNLAREQKLPLAVRAGGTPRFWVPPARIRRPISTMRGCSRC